MSKEREASAVRHYQEVSAKFYGALDPGTLDEIERIRLEWAIRDLGDELRKLRMEGY